MLQAAGPESTATIIPMAELQTNTGTEAAYYDHLTRGATGADRAGIMSGQHVTGSWGMVPVTGPAQPAHQPSIHSHQTHHFRQPLPAHGATLLAAIPSAQRRQTFATSAAAAAMAMAAYAGSQANHANLTGNRYGNGGHTFSTSNNPGHHVSGNTINHNVARPTRTKDSNSSQLSPVKKRVKESSPPKWSTEHPMSNSTRFLESGYVSVVVNSPMSSMNYEMDNEMNGRSAKSVLIMKNQNGGQTMKFQQIPPSDGSVPQQAGHRIFSSISQVRDSKILFENTVA